MKKIIFSIIFLFLLTPLVNADYYLDKLGIQEQKLDTSIKKHIIEGGKCSNITGLNDYNVAFGIINNMINDKEKAYTYNTKKLKALVTKIENYKKEFRDIKYELDIIEDKIYDVEYDIRNSSLYSQFTEYEIQSVIANKQSDLIKESRDKLSFYREREREYQNDFDKYNELYDKTDSSYNEYKDTIEFGNNFIENKINLCEELSIKLKDNIEKELENKTTKKEIEEEIIEKDEIDKKVDLIFIKLDNLTKDLTEEKKLILYKNLIKNLEKYNSMNKNKMLKEIISRFILRLNMKV